MPELFRDWSEENEWVAAVRLVAPWGRGEGLFVYLDRIVSKVAKMREREKQ